MTVIFSSDSIWDLPRVRSEVECGNDSARMDLFKGTNCLVCPVCKELRWLV